ncbi:puromycin sensitive aminopeptidase [Thecamonas trahens ATCC 50062]|uniref:Aminopeptidase n=1 Tax=Thecamonas trahens ATCC 50062 TaxID=461836 RepID=A0A0L0DSJ4_THETB|nr:puromycin sensitive aminopeptidase [Thecamonas trahens ATCC 50062]KNC54423.1 puromycin sensitive aminopeptidase [Thecamonas trahens ATCC 50062]|eukprot:XP_013753718.1 puromycin sensitive aminopeptidase [Thecamonas trahens ATCC 50062]
MVSVLSVAVVVVAFALVFVERDLWGLAGHDDTLADSAAFFLPTHTLPSHYSVHLTPDLEAFTFAGKCEIKVNSSADSQTIVVHAKELTIHSVSYNGEAAASHSYDETLEQLTIELAGEGAKAGADGVLAFTYDGVLNDQMAGFYRSKYNSKADGTGEERYMAVTQFEATDARRAFPCFDEPALKATFDVTLVVPADRVALSNMNIVSETLDEAAGKRTVTFATSPIMSTYLLAFVVGELDYVEAHTQIGNIAVRVYTPVGLADQGRFALDVGVKVLDFYQDYYAKEYPLPKLDMVAIPDFAAGAMENWGLVTYRSVLLLYNEETTPASIKQRLAYVVGHELAHQWFGNLVTMDSWTYLYLNEAFATYVGWAATHAFFPEWQVWNQYVVNDFQRALELDALESSHPIEVAIENPNKVDEIFDAISYCKGSAVVRMLVAYLGEETFRAGMRDYVAKFAYGNTKTEDLWACLSAASGKDVPGLMNTWVNAVGYPVVSVSRTSPTTLAVTQERFLSTGRPAATPVAAPEWNIPLRAVSGADPAAASEDLLTAATGEIAVAADAWVKLNQGQVGFYRVAYDAESIALLSSSDALAALSPVDRVGLVNDAFALAAAGYGSTPLALDLIAAVGSAESEYIVWADIASSLSAVAKAWTSDADLAGLRTVYGRLFAPLAAKLGWAKSPGESYQDSQLRPLALSRAIRANVASVVDEAKARFDAGTVHPDLQSSVYWALLSVASPDDAAAMHNKLVAEYNAATSQDTKVVLLSAIGGVPTRDLAHKVAVWAAESGDVRNQDLFYVVGSLLGSAVGRAVVWDYVSSNFDALEAKFQGAFLLARIVKMVVGSLTTQDALDAANAFFAARDVSSYERPLKQAVEEVTARLQWIERDGAAVSAWLAVQAQEA